MMEISNFQWIDYGILLIMGISIVFGLMRGLIRSAFSLVTWITAFVLSKQLGHALAEQFTFSINSPTIRLAIAFCIVFLLILMIGMMLGRLVSSVFRAIGLSGLDSVLGIAFGALRGALIVAVLLFIGGMLGFDTTDAWQKSPLRPYWDPAIVWLQEKTQKPLPEVKSEQESQATGTAR